MVCELHRAVKAEGCYHTRTMAARPPDPALDAPLDGLARAGSTVPEEAIAALIALGAAAVAPLLRLLDEIEVDEDDWTPLWIAVTLGELRSPAAVPALLRLMALPEGDVLAEAAGEAIAKIGVPALPALTVFAREERAWEARHHAYAALGQIPGEVSLRFLIGALDRDPLLWTAIAMALADLGDPQGIPALKALLPRCEAREAAAVREALDILEGRQPSYPRSHARPWRQRCAELAL